MSTSAGAGTRTVQVHRIHIKATPDRIWAAIVDPELNRRYGYAAPGFYELRPGGSYRSTPNDGMREYAAAHGHTMPEVIVDGEVVEADPPRRLVQTWRLAMDPACAAEGFTTLTWEIDESPERPGVCRLTVTHDVTGAPATARMVAGDVERAGGGWPMTLSDLKTFLETGTSFHG